MTRSRLNGSQLSNASQSGFTLTEVLVAITIIGLLAGFLAPVVLNSLRTAKEATITMETKQLELAIENFKTEFGFYPPTFLQPPASGGLHRTAYDVTISNTGGPIGIQTPAVLLRYLNRISPQHNERISTGIVASGGTYPDGSRSRLEHWWYEVGQYMDQRSSLVFWLSGLCTNKQFPLTGYYADAPDTNSNGIPDIEETRWAAGVPPLAAHNYQSPIVDSLGVEHKIERKVFYDFKIPQTDFYDTTLTEQDPGTATAWIAMYSQGYGKGDNLHFLYRDHSSYDIGGQDVSTWGDSYRLGPSDGSETTLPTSVSPVAPYAFANPNSFQLIAPGMDGVYGPGGNVFGIEVQGVLGSCNPGEVPRTNDTGAPECFVGLDGADNIANFAEGRVDKWVINNSD